MEEGYLLLNMPYDCYVNYEAVTFSLMFKCLYICLFTFLSVMLDQSCGS
jgi:hypothetical protein